MAVAAVASAGLSSEAEAAQSTETFFRTMSETHYEQLLATGRVPATAETFISPSLEYASQYSGITVQLEVEAGTTDALLTIGVRNAGLTDEIYANLPLVQRGWTATSAFFKLEGDVVNIGLGRGTALDIFNSSLVNFGSIP